MSVGNLKVRKTIKPMIEMDFLEKIVFLKFKCSECGRISDVLDTQPEPYCICDERKKHES